MRNNDYRTNRSIIRNHDKLGSPEIHCMVQDSGAFVTTTCHFDGLLVDDGNSQIPDCISCSNSRSDTAA